MGGILAVDAELATLVVVNILEEWAQTAENYGFDGDAETYRSIAGEIQTAMILLLEAQHATKH